MDSKDCTTHILQQNKFTQSVMEMSFGSATAQFFSHQNHISTLSVFIMYTG